VSSAGNESRPARIASFLKSRREARSFEEDAIEPRVHAGLAQISDEQNRVWLHCSQSGRSEMYNNTFSLSYSGNLNRPAVENAINEILRRHDAWRTSFDIVDDKVVQKVKPELKIDLMFSDLTNLPAEQREAQIAELAAMDSKQPFVLTDAPLLRARLIQVSDTDFRLTLVVHELISDCFSMHQIFLPELQKLYSAFVQGTKPHLPLVPFQYCDYAEWQRRPASAGTIEENLKFWDQELAGKLPVTNLPLDRRRPATRKFEGGAELFQLTAEVTNGLKQVADSCGVSIFMLALSAFHALVYHYTRECDQLLGCLTSTRKMSGTEALLGLFSNVLPIRSKFSPDDLFPAVVRQVRDKTLSGLEHEVPFDLLARRFGSRVPSTTPFLQVLFVFEQSALDSEEWRVEEGGGYDSPFARWDFSLVFEESHGRLSGSFKYSRDIFNPETISNIRNSWVTLLGDIVANPNRSLDHLSKSLSKSQHKGMFFRAKWFERYFRRAGRSSSPRH
jgi:hypothetical protein